MEMGDPHESCGFDALTEFSRVERMKANPKSNNVAFLSETGSEPRKAYQLWSLKELAE
jgi:hypothetical protein